jgi:L-asparaginase II
VTRAIPGAHVPLVVATRGNGIECVHYGSVAVVDRSGSLVAGVGATEFMTFARSSLKPFQVMPLLSHPEFDRFGFTAAEIAVFCASHSGEPRHVQTVLTALEKAGCRKEDLRCGIHAPMYIDALGELPLRDDVFTPLHNNCSGKHAAMLALARLLGAPPGEYLDAEHPVQVQIRNAVAWFAELDVARLERGVDGCGAPAYALPLASLARAHARLATAATDERYGEAPRRIYDAMHAHPAMVSGFKRLDLALTMAGRGEWVTKGGAEGVQAIAVRSRGLGVAVKIADGAARARNVAAVEVMRQLGLLGDIEGTPLSGFARPAVTNWHAVEVGRLEPVFTLRFEGS